MYLYFIVSYLITGYYECLCKRYYTGIHCEFHNPAADAGIGKPTAATQPPTTLPQECIDLGCDRKASNKKCDVSP